MRVDLQKLDEFLAQGRPAVLLEEFLKACALYVGPYNPDLAGVDDWRQLQLASTVSDKLHETTVKRLTNNPSIYEYGYGEAVQCALRQGEPDLACMIKGANAALCGQSISDFRTGPVVAPAGYTTLVAHFPDAAKVNQGVSLAQEFRNYAPLGHPVWNALLLQLLLLRLHPFMNGNGRTFRALVNYELQRAGVLGPFGVPVRKILDANRANDILLRTRVTQSKDPVIPVAEALSFDLCLLTLALQAGSGVSVKAPPLNEIAPDTED